MCVSKRWYNLVFNPYFLSRFSCVRLQTDSQTPVTRTMIVTNPKNPSNFFSMSSEQPLGPTKFRNFSLSFLPCFQGPPVVSTSTDEFEPGPTVLASYNDLLLCCATMFSQRDYYICNPYTKQWDALPPPPQCYDLVKVGLICNPGNQLGVLNNEYSYRVVRIIIPPSPVYPSKQFKVHIFASENRTWTETVVSSPREFTFGYDGMLYFGGSRGLIGLELYSSNINATSTIHCRFIDLPEDKANVMDLPEDDQVKFIDLPEDLELEEDLVCGCASPLDILRMDTITMMVWVKRWCLVDIVPLNWVRRQCPSITDCTCKYKFHVDNCTRVLGFDPYNEDILYLEFCQHLVMYNVGSKTLMQAWRTDLFSYGDVIPGGTVLPYVIPRWPTLVLGHKQRDEGSSSYPTSNPISYPSVSTGRRSSSRSTRSGLEEIVANRKGGTKEHMSKRRRPAVNSKASKKRKANEASG
ncbi:unnamed protein product [Malus baccata var. baccata]